MTHRPFTTREGKVVHVAIQKPGEPASVREKMWGAHERLTIQRETATVAPKTKRPASRRAKKR